MSAPQRPTHNPEVLSAAKITATLKQCIGFTIVTVQAISNGALHISFKDVSGGDWWLQVSTQTASCTLTAFTLNCLWGSCVVQFQPACFANIMQ